MVSIDHTQHVAGIRNPHFEVLPLRDNKLVVYPLKESLGALRPVSEQLGDLTIRVSGSEDDTIALRWDSKGGYFHATLPNDLANTAPGTWSLPDGNQFDFDFPLYLEE